MKWIGKTNIPLQGFFEWDTPWLGISINWRIPVREVITFMITNKQRVDTNIVYDKQLSIDL